MATKLTHDQLSRALNMRLQGYTWNTIYDRVGASAGPVLRLAAQQGLLTLIKRLRGTK